MSAHNKAKLLWIDLEMTGLDPERDRILEVAAIATDIDLNEIARFEAVVRVPDELIAERMVGDFWEKNSASRDALIAQNAAGRPIAEVEQDLLVLLDQYFGKQIFLAGNSIHQDRKFIEREMPALNQRLHYRMLDVSAWKIYFEQGLKQKFDKPDLHRALDDIEGSIEEFRWYLTFLKDSSANTGDTNILPAPATTSTIAVPSGGTTTLITDNAEGVIIVPDEGTTAITTTDNTEIAIITAEENGNV